jgi:hypothetical protein
MIMGKECKNTHNPSMASAFSLGRSVFLSLDPYRYAEYANELLPVKTTCLMFDFNTILAEVGPAVETIVHAANNRSISDILTAIAFRFPRSQAEVTRLDRARRNGDLITISEHK